MSALGVSLITFMDYVGAANPTTKVSVVKRAKEFYEDDTPYEMRAFWEPFKRAAVEDLKNGSDRLSSVVAGATDRRRTSYDVARRGLRTWLDSASVEFGSQPKKSIWRAGGLEVSCNPEVGLRIDGRPTIVKLYPKQEKLAVRKVEPALALLQRTHGGDDRDVAVLDVRRSRLHTLTREIPGIDALLAAEAAAFLVMWRSL